MVGSRSRHGRRASASRNNKFLSAVEALSEARDRGAKLSTCTRPAAGKSIHCYGDIDIAYKGFIIVNEERCGLHCGL